MAKGSKRRLKALVNNVSLIQERWLDCLGTLSLLLYFVFDCLIGFKLWQLVLGLKRIGNKDTFVILLLADDLRLQVSL